MKIKEFCIFAYATRAAALEVANDAEEDMCVAAINIIQNSFSPSPNSVAWIVVREKVFKLMTGSGKEKRA